MPYETGFAGTQPKHKKLSPLLLVTIILGACAASLISTSAHAWGYWHCGNDDWRETVNGQFVGNTRLRNCAWVEVGGGHGAPSGSGGGPGSGGPFSPNLGEMQQVRDAGEKDCRRGNPIIPNTGNKIEAELDFESAGEMPLYLRRTYNHYWNYIGIFGKHWISSFDYSLSPTHPSNPSIWAQRPDGRRIKFRKTTTDPNRWNEDKPESVAYLQRNADGSFILYTEDDTIERYNSNGYILELKNRQGIGWIFAYNASNYLQTVTHTSGRYVQFTWTSGQLTQVRDPAGNTYSYTYTNNAFGSGIHRLASAVLPGTPQTTVSYHYERAGMPGALTGKSYGGVRYSTFDYDSAARAKLSEHAGSVERYSFTYTGSTTPPTNPPPDPPPPGGICNPMTGVCTHPQGEIEPGEEREVAERAAIAAEADRLLGERVVNLTVVETNPLGKQTTYQFEEGKLTSLTGHPSTYCEGQYSEIIYDSNGFKDRVIDFAGTPIDFNYDAKGRLYSVHEGSHLPHSQRRRTAFDWHATDNRTIASSISDRIGSIYEYDSNYRVIFKKDYNLRGQNGNYNQERITAYTYTSHGNGMIATIVMNGPLPGNGDAITSTYSVQGDLVSIKNSLNHSISYSNYDGLGRPGNITGPNGDVTDYTYDARGRVARVRAYTGSGTADTTYAYNATGLLASVTLPDGVTTSYTYDSARRLIQLQQTEPAGTVAKIIYAYDNASDIVSETIYRGTTVHFSRYSDYDELSRPRAQRGNSSQNIRFSYDLNGNLKTITDSLNRITALEYDHLNLLTRQIDAKSGQTRFLNDTAGRPIQITDPRNFVTSYAYDGFGQLWSQTSPDTGTTMFQWDAYGRRTSMTRANGQVTTYGYDGLGRVTSATASGQTVTYTFDSCTNGKGRLCKVTDSTGSVEYTYTPEGWLASQYTIYGDPSAYSNFNFAYDSMGRVTTIHNVVNGVETYYTYSGGKVSQVRMKRNGVVYTVADNIKYQPFGPISELTYGNGHTRQYIYDQDWRLTAIHTDNVQGLYYSYNANNLITQLTNGRNGSYSQTFGYDELSRLTSVAAGMGNQSFAYDANGNRTSHTQGASTTNYGVAATSNRLSSLSGATAASFGYNGNGSTTSISSPSATYGYDSFNRLSSITRAGATTTYHINGLNQRVRKFGGPATSTWYVYGPNHTLLADVRSDVGYTDYIWLGGELLAIARNHGAGAHWFVHPDQVGRPEVVTKPDGTTAWWAINRSHDRTVMQDTVNGLHIGFAGQYYDTESGHWYNVHRTYDSRTGRYLQSDPIGLLGGISTYTYVQNNPINLTDPTGLCPISLTLGSNGLEWTGGDAWAQSEAARNIAEAMNQGMEDAISDSVCRESDSSVTEIAGAMLFGGATTGAAAGGLYGISVGIAEAGHMGALGGLALSEAAWGGAMLGTTLGIAGASVGVVGGVLIYQALPVCH